MVTTHRNRTATSEIRTGAVDRSATESNPPSRERPSGRSVGSLARGRVARFDGDPPHASDRDLVAVIPERDDAIAGRRIGVDRGEHGVERVRIDDVVQQVEFRPSLGLRGGSGNRRGPGDGRDRLDDALAERFAGGRS